MNLIFDRIHRSKFSELLAVLNIVRKDLPIDLNWVGNQRVSAKEYLEWYDNSVCLMQAILDVWSSVPTAAAMEVSMAKKGDITAEPSEAMGREVAEAIGKKAMEDGVGEGLN